MGEKSNTKKCLILVIIAMAIIVILLSGFILFNFSLPTSKPDFTITNVKTPLLLYQNAVSSSEGIFITSLNNFSGQVFLSCSWIGTQPAGVTIDTTGTLGGKQENNVLVYPNGQAYWFVAIEPTTSLYYGSIPLPTPSVGDYTLRITANGNGVSHSVDVTLEIYASS